MVNLAVDLGGLALKNPIITASGTFGYGLEFRNFLDLRELGAIIVKGLSLHPRIGSPPPRIVETPAGMLNAIGLENVGVRRFITDYLPELRSFDVPIIANIFGETVDEYVQVAEQIDGAEGVSAIELNISCPNVDEGGLAFGLQPALCQSVVASVRRATEKFLIVKLSPNVTDISEIAKSAEGGGANALSLINTVRGMAVGVTSKRPLVATVIGGLSGPAIRPVALCCVFEAARSVKIPIVGIGGINDLDSLLQFLIVGASAVQIGTANFIEPGIAQRLLEELISYCEEQGIQQLNDLIGSLELDERKVIFHGG